MGREEVDTIGIDNSFYFFKLYKRAEKWSGSWMEMCGVQNIVGSRISVLKMGAITVCLNADREGSNSEGKIHYSRERRIVRTISLSKLGEGGN